MPKSKEDPARRSKPQAWNTQQGATPYAWTESSLYFCCKRDDIQQIPSKALSAPSPIHAGNKPTNISIGNLSKMKMQMLSFLQT
mmetsp:Transcript_18435/g.42340  ORF Transcript_18435/g.42340 Transcript_18435/m.42340 type:complete len:84 (+) Transcript_18435:1356-1607(+)